VKEATSCERVPESGEHNCHRACPYLERGFLDAANVSMLMSHDSSKTCLYIVRFSMR
jgi:hypothetical protein